MSMVHFFIDKHFGVVHIIDPKQGQSTEGKYLGSIEMDSRDVEQLTIILSKTVDATLLLLSEKSLALSPASFS